MNSAEAARLFDAEADQLRQQIKAELNRASKAFDQTSVWTIADLRDVKARARAAALAAAALRAASPMSFDRQSECAACAVCGNPPHGPCDASWTVGSFPLDPVRCAACGHDHDRGSRLEDVFDKATGWQRDICDERPT